MRQRFGVRVLAISAIWPVTSITIAMDGPPIDADQPEARRWVSDEVINEKVDLPPDPAGATRSIPLSYTQWTAVGPASLLSGAIRQAGRVAALAAHPTDANTIYVAAAGGGVWKTTDGGTNWTPLTDSQATCFMGAMAIAPSDPNVIYAGTGETNNSGDSFYGRGVLRSTDGGTNWALMGNAEFNRRAISAIAVDPTDANIVYVAVHGAVNSVTGNRGVWKSIDGGLSWTNTTTGITTTTSFSDVVIDPTNPQVVYCAVGISSGAGLNGVYKTSNGGGAWAIAGDYPTGDTTNGRIRIAISKSNPQTIYSSIINSSSAGLYKMMKTTNGGTNWTQLAATPNYTGAQGWYDTTLAVDPSDENIVYAGGSAGTNSVIKSGDGGASWSDIHIGGDTPHVDHHGIGFDANGKLLDGNDGGIWRLDNPTVGSISWTNLNGNLNTIQFTGIAVHPTNADIAIGGSQDNGTEKFTGSLQWSKMVGGDGGFARIDQTTPSTYYHTYQRLGSGGTAGSGFLERSDNSGSTWASKTSGITSTDPALFYIPYVMDRANSSRLLLGTSRVYETTNRADNWTPISTPGANGWVGSSAINSLAAAPTDVNTIYAAAGSRLFVTTDHGATWNQRNPIAAGTAYNDIIADPTDSMTAYAVRGLFTVSSVNHVFRTTNAGVNWTDISGNLPDLPVWTVEVDPKGPGSADDVLYVGTDAAVYRSLDLGATWSVYASGFPNAQVVELEFDAGRTILAAGTHGRGMWEILVPTAPTISVPNETTACGSPFTSMPPASSGAPAPNWTLLAGPAGMTIDATTGQVTWPNPLASTTLYTITVQASNIGGSVLASWTLTVRPGDFNGNGRCDDDIADFVDHLLGVSIARLCAADVNLDGSIDGMDIAPFVLCSLTP